MGDQARRGGPRRPVAGYFRARVQCRELDIRAAPYDLRDWGFDPIRIETPEGKAEYVRQQREISARADVLRGRLLQVVDVALSRQ